MVKLDSDPTVLEWSSEEMFVLYTSPLDNRIHRYYPDMVLKKRIDGEVKSFMIEIKPMAQTKVPKKGKKSHKQFLKETKTYAVNAAKWESAERYCKKHGMIFQVITERELKIKW